MPERRTARQTAASRRNLAIARINRWSAAELAAPRKLPKAIASYDRKNDAGSPWDTPEVAAAKTKAIRLPQGKTVLLRHGTKRGIADKIVREGFRATGTKSRRRNAYFLQYGSKTGVSRGDYGHEAVLIKVPRKKIVNRKSMWSGDTPEITVKYKDLEGVKVRRIL